MYKEKKIKTNKIGIKILQSAYEKHFHLFRVKDQYMTDPM